MANRALFAAGGLTLAEKTSQHGLRLLVDDGRQQELDGKGAPELDTREVVELRDALTEWLRLVGGEEPGL